MSIISLLTYAVIASFTPGPNNIISMTYASNQGFRKTLPFIAGVATGCLLIMLLSSYFNLMLDQYIPIITPYLNLLGCVYMLYLAIKIMWSRSSKSETHQIIHYSFSFGFTLQFVNPKVILYGLTAVSMFVMPYEQSHVQLILFALLLTLIGVSANMSWAFGGRLFQSILRRYERPFNIVMGILLIYMALSFLK